MRTNNRINETSNGKARTAKTSPLVQLTLAQVQQVMMCLETICHGGIALDVTPHAATIKNILIDAAHASGAVPTESSAPSPQPH